MQMCGSVTFENMRAHVDIYIVRQRRGSYKCRRVRLGGSVEGGCLLLLDDEGGGRVNAYCYIFALIFDLKYVLENSFDD